MADRLTAFLYLLMREHVPTGTVKALVDRVANDEELTLTAGELEALALRYSLPLRVMPDGGEEDAERVTGDGEEGRVQQIERDDQGVLQPVVGDGFSREMMLWLDEFDDRLTSSPQFVQAVNEAAASEMVADDVSARLVAQRTKELEEAAVKQPVGPDDETERGE